MSAVARFAWSAARVRPRTPPTCTSGRAVPGCPPEQALGHLRMSLAALLPHAAACGVHLAIEYEPGLLVERATQALRLFAAAGSPWLGLNLDVGHAWVAGEDPAEVVFNCTQHTAVKTQPFSYLLLS